MFFQIQKSPNRDCRAIIILMYIIRIIKMSWEYSQSTGQLTYNGELITNDGYSGKSIWKNNPAAEPLRNRGPIPRGSYRIGSAKLHPKIGSVTMALTPVGHSARGRTAFLNHGDSIQHPGSA